ncbi:MAG: hypothetical protein IKV89_03795, partial [Clostridia bacterium]|nr:hypothetical protein [Clostridia bacterium]
MKAKKILSLLVAMVMVFSCVGITAMAETVNTLDELLNAIENGDGNITLGADIDLNENSYVAQIGDIKYTDLQKAIDEAVEDVTITLLNDVIVTEAAYGQNALNYAKAVDCTIDLNGYTISANTGNSVFRFNISEANATSDVTVTLKNGKVVSGADTWCAVMACGASEDVKAVFNLEDLTIENSKAYDFGVKAWENSVINAKNVTINATKQAGGFYAVGGEIVLDDCTVNQSGLYTAPYTSMAVAVASNGKLTVNSGSYTTTPTAAEEGNGQGSTHGSWCGGVMNSGGSLIINGGTFANGNYGDDSLATAARGLIVADTGAYLEINGGTFNALKGIVDIQNNLGDASKNPTGTITGGTFSADPTNNYVTIAEGYELVANENGTYGVEEEKTVTGLSGTGTAEDPYLINNLDELIWFRDTVNTSDRSNQYIGKYVKLTADIDLSDETWEPIGQNIVGDHTAFLGTFDGGGHTISNLCVESTQQNTGFFANTGSYNDTEKAVVKNIIFNNVDVSSTSSHVGGVIGNAGGNTYVENVKLTGYIYIAGSGGYVGGIVGHGYPKVSNCSVTAESGSYINCGYWSVGGIVGYGGEGGTKITDSFVKGLGEDGLTIWGAYGGAAAICGNPRTGVTAENVYAENVHITGANYASGYLMGNNGGTIINGGVTNVTLGEGIEAADAVATIGESVYFNFADAMTAAQDGDTVKLVRDAALTDTLIYNKTGNITIDGNGKTITLADGFTNTNDWAAAIVLGN